MIAPGDRLFDAVVLGSGPAGATAALGLSRLGYTIAVVSRTRSAGVEGLSARALVSLREAGLGSAAECATGAARRVVRWAGEVSERGHESLVQRGEFDVRLCSALRSVETIDASVRGFQFMNDVWQVETSVGVLRGRIVLDARGRQARRSDSRGPLLVAWSVTQQTGENSDPASAVVALNDGWCWFARTGGGTLSLQFIGSARQALDTQEFAQRIRSVACALPALQPEIDVLLGSESVHARAAVARHSRPSRGTGFLRIGDAAVAMDPLSGNGIHEAVRSGRVAVAAVNSYLRGTPWSVVARFFDERAGELWRRSVAAAAGFYRAQARASSGEFWTWAAAAYEEAAERPAIQHEGSARFEMRPVLDGDSIDLRRVWVCAEWPRGVWKVDGRSLDEAPVEQIPFILRRAAGVVRNEV